MFAICSLFKEHWKFVLAKSCKDYNARRMQSPNFLGPRRKINSVIYQMITIDNQI